MMTTPQYLATFPQWVASVFLSCVYILFSFYLNFLLVYLCPFQFVDQPVYSNGQSSTSSSTLKPSSYPTFPMTLFLVKPSKPSSILNLLKTSRLFGSNWHRWVQNPILKFTACDRGNVWVSGLFLKWNGKHTHGRKSNKIIHKGFVCGAHSEFQYWLEGNLKWVHNVAGLKSPTITRKLRHLPGTSILPAIPLKSSVQIFISETLISVWN